MKEWIEIGLAVILGLPGLYFGFRFGWRVFHHFVSLNEDFHLSNIDWVIKRISFAGLTGILAFMFIAWPTYILARLGIDALPNWGEAQSPVAVAPAPVAPQSGKTPSNSKVSEPIEPSYAVTKVGAEQADEKKSYHADGFVESQNKSEDAPVDKPSEQQNKAPQYTGNDPIVRQRLGLPPNP